MRCCYSEIIKKNRSINKVLKESVIKIAFSTLKTQNMIHNKDPIRPEESSSLVYKYSCEQCQACYIGETRRQLSRRIKEHLTGRPPSEISMHEHPPSRKNFSILIKTRYTRTAESLLIRKYLRDGVILMNNNKTSEFLSIF